MMRVLVGGGPTAVGKTEYALALASLLRGEIINADSMQVYRGLDIGTAKIKKEEQQGIPHHLFDCVDVDAPFDVAQYQRLARQCIEEITARGHLPILVGGTGLYVRATLFDYQFPAKEGHPILPLSKEATGALYEQLQILDPLAAAQIHPNNRQRIERALQRVAESGPLKEVSRPDLLYDALFVGLTRPREELYARINQRVLVQFEQGLEQEAKDILTKTPPGTTARQAIGYKEFIPYMEGQLPLSEVLASIQRHTRRYAKRQYTWWTHQFPMQWIEVGNRRLPNDALCEIQNLVKAKWSL
jgi:tRNA dimethylallyltransferase